VNKLSINKRFIHDFSSKPTLFEVFIQNLINEEMEEEVWVRQKQERMKMALFVIRVCRDTGRA
jgi:hypothetical protein